jgi:hypothetical protein
VSAQGPFGQVPVNLVLNAKNAQSPDVLRLTAVPDGQ